jgi:hypothetical protein
MLRKNASEAGSAEDRMVAAVTRVSRENANARRPVEADPYQPPVSPVGYVVGGKPEASVGAHVWHNSRGHAIVERLTTVAGRTMVHARFLDDDWQPARALSLSAFVGMRSTVPESALLDEGVHQLLDELDPFPFALRGQRDAEEQHGQR